MSAGDQCSAASTEAISDDALFRDKLKHMGKCECPVSIPFTDVLLSLVKTLRNKAEPSCGQQQSVLACCCNCARLADGKTTFFFDVHLVCFVSLLSILQRHERNFLKSPEHFLKRQSGENPNGRSC